MRESEAAFVRSMSGTDESTGQTLTTRAEYSHRDFRWNTGFRDIVVEDADGVLHIDYAKFDELEPVADADGAADS